MFERPEEIVFMILLGFGLFTGEAMSSVYFDDSGPLIRVGNSNYEITLSKENGAISSSNVSGTLGRGSGHHLVECGEKVTICDYFVWGG